MVCASSRMQSQETIAHKSEDAQTTHKDDPMDMEKAEVVEILNQLIVTNLDSVNGYETAASAVENPDYRQIFEEYAGQRRQFASELSELVSQSGGDPEQGGNLAGAFQRAWMNIKATLTEGDQAIMEECDRSDQAALELYAEILPQNLPEAAKVLVRRQLVDVRIAHERVHAINGALAQR